MKLIRRNDNTILAEHVEVANGFVDRLRGLLGKTSYPKDTAMWIDPCNSIHTFFMKFSIDAVFVDKQLCVKSVHTDLPAWRLIPPVIGAKSVF